MSRDKDVVEKSKGFLLKNNEALRSLVVEPLCDSDITIEKLSDFIEACWKRDYGSEGRIIFSPEFIKFNIPDISKDRVSLVGIMDGNLVGAFLFFPMSYRMREEDVKGGIVTGLSTHDQLRGKRISQFLVLCIEERLIDNHIQFAQFWLDDRHDSEGSSYQTYRNEKKRTEWNKTVPLCCKPFNVKMLAKVTKMSAIEKFGAQYIQWRFPSKFDLPKGIKIDSFRESDIHKWIDFIHNHQPQTLLRRHFTSEELTRKLGYNKGRTKSVALKIERQGEMQGVVYGFTVPVGDFDLYAQLDGIILHPQLSRRDKRKIIGSCERAIIEEHSCFSSAIAASATSEQLTDFGYIELMTQTLGANFYDPTIPQDSLNSILVELR